MEYFLTTFLDPTYLTVQKGLQCVGWGTKFLDHFSKNFNEEKKVFCLRVRVDNGEGKESIGASENNSKNIF